MRPLVNQLAVSPLVTQDLNCPSEALLEPVRASNNDQRRALGHREDDWRESRRAFKSVTGAVLRGSEPPKAGHLRGRLGPE